MQTKKLIEAREDSLYGLVNNAGVADFGPLIEVEESDFDEVLQVNLYGAFRTTKLFSDHLIANRGRIVTICSVAGILSSSFLGPYSISKHALEAFNDTLGEEMAEFEVKVSIIEPGNYDSKMVERTFAKASARTHWETESQFSQIRQMFSAPLVEDQETRKKPDEIVNAVEHALFDEFPLDRYLVVPSEDEAHRTIKQAIRDMVQLNKWHSYTYTRES